MSSPAERTLTALAQTLIHDWRQRLGEEEIFGAAVGVAIGQDSALQFLGAPASHRFVLGSITKLLTALCVAESVRRNDAITLKTPVNALLDGIKLSHPYADAVTLEHLLTHRAGFDYADWGLAAPLDFNRGVDPMKTFVPPFARAPGGLPAYSNFGVALLGRVLEAQLRQPFASILQTLVLDPIGLNATTLANVHETGDAPGRLALHPFFAPAGGLVSSAADALAFGRVLASPHRAPPDLRSALQAVASPLFETPDGVVGIGMLASRFVARGVLLVGHTGSWPSHDALLLAAPDFDAALFCAIHVKRPASSRQLLWGAATQRFLDALGPAAVRKHTSASRTLLRDGDYVSTKLPVATIERAAHLWSRPMAQRVLQSGDGIQVGGVAYQPASSRESASAEREGLSLSSLALGKSSASDPHWFMQSAQREAHVRSVGLSALYPFRSRAIALVSVMASWPIAAALSFNSATSQLLPIALTAFASACAFAISYCLESANRSQALLRGSRGLLLAARAGAWMLLALCATSSIVFANLFASAKTSDAHVSLFVAATWCFCLAMYDMRVLAPLQSTAKTMSPT